MGRRSYNKAKVAEGVPLTSCCSPQTLSPSSEAEQVEEIISAYNNSDPSVRDAMTDSLMPVALRTLRESGGNPSFTLGASKLDRQSLCIWLPAS